MPRHRFRLRYLLASLAVLATAAQAQDQGPKKPRREANRISAEEIEAIRDQVSDAYVIVQRLRPALLRTRGNSSITAMNADPGRSTPRIRIFLDGVDRGEIEVLNTISAQVIQEIKYMSGPDTTTLYGTGYDAGALFITTRGR